LNYQMAFQSYQITFLFQNYIMVLFNIITNHSK
jgi:hypothetical protein